MRRLVILVSGNGGNVKFFHQASLAGLVRNIDVHVVADRECGAVDYARKHGLGVHVIRYKKSSPEQLRPVLERIDPDLIVTNWHKIIDADTVAAYRGKLINLHYSLLPAFAGLNEPIQMAYDQGCRFIGPTCHAVDEGMDSGEILGQAVFETNVSIRDAWAKMFRLGCLLLLNELNKRVDADFVRDQEHPQPAPAWFSPPLTYAHEAFDNPFWANVAKA